jgi:hypothetical protein
LEKKQNQEARGVRVGEGKGEKRVGEDMAQTMYAHMNKCINNFKKQFLCPIHMGSEWRVLQHFSLGDLKIYN